MLPIVAFGKVFAVTAHAGLASNRLHPLQTPWWIALVGLVFTGGALAVA